MDTSVVADAPPVVIVVCAPSKSDSIVPAGVYVIVCVCNVFGTFTGDDVGTDPVVLSFDTSVVADAPPVVIVACVPSKSDSIVPAGVYGPL